MKGMTMAKSIQGLMKRLMNAADPEEKRVLTAQVNRLSEHTVDPEERLELYHAALQAVRERLLEEAEKDANSPVTPALRQAAKDIQRRENCGDGFNVNDRVTRELLALLHPTSTALEEALDPAEVRRIIRQAQKLLGELKSQELRKAGYWLLRQFMENEVLAHLGEVQSYDRLLDEPPHGERYLCSLLGALEIPAHPALALSFLRYDVRHDVFYSVTPAELAVIDEKKALASAMTDYISATHAITRQEAADCTEELKHHILLRLLRWLERENLTQYQEIGIRAHFLQEISHGVFSGKAQARAGESLQAVLEALDDVYALGMEMEEGNLALTCHEQVERLNKCVCLKGALADMTAFALVTQICRSLLRLNIPMPETLKQLVKLYIALSLSAQNTYPGAALVWATTGKQSK